MYLISKIPIIKGTNWIKIPIKEGFSPTTIFNMLNKNAEIKTIIAETTIAQKIFIIIPFF